MEMIKKCMCENCGRSNEVVEIEQLSISGHVAELCVTCAHILSQTINRESYYELCRKKDVKSSNKEMQKVHHKLSMLIAVGMVFIVTITALGISQNLHTVSGTLANADQLQQAHNYMSFVHLKQLK
ncbi:DNA polymerase III subunit delta [Solibacillus sp. FSL H8-0538]|uniref:DNA polymerase III subunit delta n=1 Tax=Solibacillus sp. FSL H8-0538 TaxID=2921400 RepID=UPI0030F9826A